MSINSTDPIADMLTRIRNAISVRQTEVSLPHSQAKEAVAKLLASSGFIDGVSVEKAEIGKTMTVQIHGEGSNARISSIRRLSTPGRRYYVRSSAIPTVKRGRGLVIVSTSKGVMTGSDAKKAGIGGELICEVY